MTLEPLDLVGAAVIGLVAGLAGGLAGIGGSLIMLPGLAWVFGYPGGDYARHHLYMASAMTVNVLVALPSAWRHHREGAVRFDLLKALFPAMLAAIVVGVLISNLVHGEWLKLMLAAFIAAYCVMNLARIIRRENESHEESRAERAGGGRLVAIGGAAGFAAGLLGLGGGVVMVPMLQVAAGVKLRQAIATSSAVMALTAVVGATLKVSTLGSHDLSIADALLLAAAMGPTAIIGARLGAPLTHRLPIIWVRTVITALLLLAAARLAGIWGGNPSGGGQEAAPGVDSPSGASPGPGAG